MKVYPTPKKRNIITTSHYDVVSSTIIVATPNRKKLKRLPHVFAKVLELPFHSDVDVLVQETPDEFRFVADSREVLSITEDFCAHVVEIFPGVEKIVIRGSDGFDYLSVDELDMDTWRFRLPATTLVEMASATCIGGQLVVTVPKTVNLEGGVIDDSDDVVDNETMVHVHEAVWTE